MEKQTREKLEHVYSEDMQKAISKARAVIRSGEQIKEKRKKYRPIDYRVEREKTEIVTIIIYEEVK